jgi:hypothetical protein
LTSDCITSLGLQPLNLRCLALTGSFETDCLPPGCFGLANGDFDGQGISFSALQWSVGQGTLQPLLTEMNSAHPDLMNRAFGDGYDQVAGMLATPRSRQMAWSRSIQTTRHTLQDPWGQRFHDLGQTAEFQAIAMRHAAVLYEGATSLCSTLGLKSQRAVAMLFDIKVQNGGIGPVALTLIDRDFAMLAPGDPDVLETAKMRKIGNRVADASNVRWREDVRSRKLAIANGTGVVHGVHFDLAAQFALTLGAWNGS